MATSSNFSQATEDKVMIFKTEETTYIPPTIAGAYFHTRSDEKWSSGVDGEVLADAGNGHYLCAFWPDGDGIHRYIVDVSDMASQNWEFFESLKELNGASQYHGDH